MTYKRPVSGLNAAIDAEYAAGRRLTKSELERALGEEPSTITFEDLREHLGYLLRTRLGTRPEVSVQDADALAGPLWDWLKGRMP